LRYSEPPESYAASLIACCHDTAQNAGRLAEKGSELAARVGAPSRALVALRAAALEQLESLPPADTGRGARTEEKASGIGPVESRLRSLGIDNARHLWRASAIDRAADQVIREATAANARGGSPSARSSFGMRAQDSAVLVQRHAEPQLEDREAEP